jgi:molecular chaperone DnaK
MKAEAEANADADKKKKEEVDKLNGADALIFQTEKQLKEYGDKLPADKKEPIESALAELKTAHEAKDFAAIDSATEKLNTVFQAASQEMYAQDGAAGAEGTAGDASAENVEAEDVDFEEVEEEK